MNLGYSIHLHLVDSYKNAVREGDNFNFLACNYRLRSEGTIFTGMCYSVGRWGGGEGDEGSYQRALGQECVHPSMQLVRGVWRQGVWTMACEQGVWTRGVWTRVCGLEGGLVTPPETATDAVGMHPIGMHSCFCIFAGIKGEDATSIGSSHEMGQRRDC